MASCCEVEIFVRVYPIQIVSEGWIQFLQEVSQCFLGVGCPPSSFIKKLSSHPQYIHMWLDSWRDVFMDACKICILLVCRQNEIAADLEKLDVCMFCWITSMTTLWMGPTSCPPPNQVYTSIANERCSANHQEASRCLMYSNSSICSTFSRCHPIEHETLVITYRLQIQTKYTMIMTRMVGSGLAHWLVCSSLDVLLLHAWNPSVHPLMHHHTKLAVLTATKSSFLSWCLRVLWACLHPIQGIHWQWKYRGSNTWCTKLPSNWGLLACLTIQTYYYAVTEMVSQSRCNNDLRINVLSCTEQQD